MAVIPAAAWLYYVDTSPGDDRGRGVATDPDGNVYVSGYSADTTATTIRFGSNAAFPRPVITGRAMYVGKLNSAGVPQWMHWIEEGNWDNGNTICADSLGNAYFTGTHWSSGTTTLKVNGVAYPKPITFGDGAFVGKVNSAGTLEWLNWIDSGSADASVAIYADPAGNTYITGYSQGSGPLTVGGVSFSRTSIGQTMAFLVKMNTSGVGQWLQWFDSRGAEFGKSVSVDASGNVYIVGNTDERFEEFRVGGVVVSRPNIGAIASYVAKVNNSGVLQWIKFMDIWSGEEYAFSVCADPAGNVYVAGKFVDRGGAGPITVAGTLYNLVSGSTYFITKLNSSGVSQWLHWNTARGMSIETDSAGNLYVAGSTSGDNAGGTTVSFGNNPTFAKPASWYGGDSGFVGMLDSSGTPQWIHLIDGPDWYETNLDVAVNSQGDVCVIGNASMSGTGVRFGNTLYSRPALGGFAAFVGKYRIPPSVPGAPTGVTAARGENRAIVSFSAPASNGGDAITAYTVTSSPGGVTATGAASPITVTGLTNGTAYTFTVRATNSVGNSVASSATAAVTPTLESLISMASTGVIQNEAQYTQAIAALTIPEGSKINLAALSVSIDVALPAETKKEAIKSVMKSIFEEKPTLTSFKVSKAELPIAAANARDNLLAVRSTTNQDAPAFTLDGVVNNATSVYVGLRNTGDCNKFSFGSVTFSILKTASGYNFIDGNNITTGYTEGQDIIYEDLSIVFGGASIAQAVFFPPISINIPLEIDAQNFATSLTVQGENVTYNHVHLPLEYQTAPADPTVANMATTFRWREDQVNQTQVEVEANATAVGSYANGKAVVKALFKAALEGGDLKNVEMTQGVVYADDSARTTIADPVKFYVNKDTHTAGTAVGSTLKAYLQEDLYDNLTKAIGLAATTGMIDITLSRSGSAASEIVAEALAEQLCGASGTEQGVAALALRQNIYEQMFTLAPERFAESEYMRRDPAANSYFRPLPFQVGDTMAFLVTFRFPASQISTPVIQSAVRTGQANVYVDTGSKVAVATPADTTSTTRPQLSDFPNCTVMLRAKLSA